MTETASAPDAVERDLYDPYLYINREISWLQFNDRVLAMVGDPEIPLLERLKYLAIFSSNLDEFFMVRVAGLRDQVEAGMVTRGSDGWTPSETLEAIAKHVGPTIERQVRVFLDDVVPAMASAGIRIDDVPDPKVQEPTDAVVRLTASAICGTDLPRSATSRPRGSPRRGCAASRARRPSPRPCSGTSWNSSRASRSGRDMIG